MTFSKRSMRRIFIRSSKSLAKLLTLAIVSHWPPSDWPRERSAGALPAHRSHARDAPFDRRTLPGAARARDRYRQLGRRFNSCLHQGLRRALRERDRHQGRARRYRAVAGQDPRHGPIRQGRVGSDRLRCEQGDRPRCRRFAATHRLHHRRQEQGLSRLGLQGGRRLLHLFLGPHLRHLEAQGEAQQLARISGTSRNSPASAPCARRRRAASRPA